jgi:ATP-dependent helicase/nuclease subunit A
MPDNPSFPIVDDDVRKRVLNPTQSFIVQAPAGSGKTELLMQRYLSLLAHSDTTEPESVLAITFTRKAATEMRNRVLQALEEVSGPEPVEANKKATRALASCVIQRDIRFGWNVLSNPSRLRIQTVDSFCHSVALQAPLASGFASLLEVAVDFDPLYLEAARRTVLMLGGGDPEIATALEKVLTNLDNDLSGVQRLIVQLLGKREQWLRIIGQGNERARLEQSLLRTIGYEMRILRRVVQEHVPAAKLTEMLSFARFASTNVDANNEIALLNGICDLPSPDTGSRLQWSALQTLLFTAGGEFRKALNKNQGFPAGAAHKDAKERCLTLLKALAESDCGLVLCDAFARLSCLPPAAYTDEQWDFLSALFRVLPCAVLHLKETFAQHGAVDHAEMAQAALDALGETTNPSVVALSLGSHVKHILVDEFQDTSVLQIELLTRLIAGWKPGNNGTLFVVGDPMQSIYGFREAEVTLFQRVREAGIGPRRPEFAPLSVNFRSASELIDWFNSTFEGVLTEDNEVAGGVKYAKAVAVRPTPKSPAVRVHAFAPKDYAAEGARVAELVKIAVAENPGKVAVLVRSRSHLAEIVPELSKAKIAFRAIEIDPLAERPVVLGLNSLTHALLHLGDRPAWLTVLRAPWCGLELSDFWKLCKGDEHSTIWDLLHTRRGDLSPAGQEHLDRVLPVLADALGSRGRFPLRDWIEKAWVSLGGPAVLRPGVDRDADLRDAAAYFNLLQECDVAGDLTNPELFKDKLSQLFAPSDIADDVRVELMTIHGAKGLEFETVFVPGLGRATRSDDTRLLNWRELVLDGCYELLLAPMERIADRKDGLTGTIEGYLRALASDRTREENKRLLYVAATRAKRELHLLCNIPEDGSKPDGRSLLALLWNIESFQAKLPNPLPTATLSPEAPPERRVAPTLRRLPADWTIPKSVLCPQWQPQSVATSETVRPLHSFHWVGETLRRVGTVAHRFLQQIGREGLEHWNEGQITSRLPMIRALLIGEGVGPNEIQTAIDKVEQVLRTALTESRGRWILSSHKDAANEFEISGILDGSLHRIKIDRTFVDEEGIRWIIDYKTSDMEGSSVEAFLDMQQEKYRKDLQCYISLMKQFDQQYIRAGLYFPLLGAWRELKLDPN